MGVTGDLGTTNVWLAIMAIVSLLEALVLIGTGVAVFLVYRRVMALAKELETRQIAPVRERVEEILGDVKAVTSRVNHQSERVNHAISGTMHRVDETADRVKDSVRDRVNRAVGIVHGLRAVIMSMLGHESRHEPPSPAAGRV